MEYEFTLTYQLDPHDALLEVVVERLGAEGCDDALVGLGFPGRISLNFTRVAPSAASAMESAMADVQRALPTARIVEASPDLVGISDVAALTGVSRQNIRKLLLTHSDTAPAPSHAGSPALWHLTDMLAWLSARLGYEVPNGLAESAAVAERINIQREMRRLEARA